MSEPEPTASASYFSSPEVLAREARALADLELADPARQRRFVLRHAGTAVLVVVVLWVLVATGHASVAGGLRGTALMLGALAVLTLMDLVLTRRRIRRLQLARCTAGCPPGTLVRGLYTPEAMTVVLPEHRIVIPWPPSRARRGRTGCCWCASTAGPSGSSPTRCSASRA
ncbi:hypothetical protein [Nostocoides sp. Soil756]|uniref:hypothetical protein n=1 Tax=Nostocoides sp. Soil756 TaxID=1736399 RepID=UPI0006F7745E|nr:hypothetical protein [Tetrasphaera sp. Soil756]KRE62576.1 hypothetical protein ASG78_06065 [Tetrasphaera sp. Soil756]